MIIDKLRDGLVALINGFVFHDGRVARVSPVDAPRALPAKIPIEDVSVTSLLTDETEWTAINPLSTASDARSGLLVTVGECGSGGDGFVALTAGVSALHWIAFFDFSNPFEDVGFHGSEIWVRNNLGEIWALPKNALGAIHIRKAKLF